MSRGESVDFIFIYSNFTKLCNLIRHYVLGLTPIYYIGSVEYALGAGGCVN